MRQVPPHWKVIETGDQSPSLHYVSEAAAESMHHSGGAFSETQYIYAPLLKAAFELCENPKILSLGLGLGYNEIFAAKLSLDYGQRDFRMQSFEIDTWLREEFLAWVRGEETILAVHYEKICSLFESTDLNIRVRYKLADLFDRGLWKMEEALVSSGQVATGTQALLWDAFSRKTSPQLWDETFLKECFSKTAEDAGLSTYASNGNLKRALKASGFEFQERQGFQGKRSSTWASRGKFPKLESLPT